MTAPKKATPKSTISPTEETPPETPPETPQEAEITEDFLDEMFENIEDFTEEARRECFQYIAQKLTHYGYACIEVYNIKDEDKLFSKMQILNDVGSSKYPKLDMQHRISEAQKYKRPVILGDSTAAELVTEILNRAGVPEHSQKQDMIRFFARALLINLPDPLKWQFPLWDLKEILGTSSDE